MALRTLLFTILISVLASPAYSQYWQQHVDYDIQVALNDENHQYTGKLTVRYANNSPDTLYKVYFHLFPNAFQPGSMMDVRSQNISDPDPRVGDRIGKLSPEEQGHLHVLSLLQKGKPTDFVEKETLLEVILHKPILPGKKSSFELEFEGQVPVQVRRSGRQSNEGIAYSMTQWYPKMCEYDRLGWHAYPYVGREFHGVWGNFKVEITMDSSYTIASTGTLKNAKAIGKGYLPKGVVPKRPAGNKLTWQFEADDVHDFAWSADKDYRHETVQVKDGPELHFFYKDTPDLRSNWGKLQEVAPKIFEYASATFGEYPYPQYTVAQGGDGGMEYPMITLITGQRKFGSLVGVTVHEALHSWYQLLLGTNEALYPWMDEGFTTYAGEHVMKHLFNPEGDSRRGRYFDGYISLALSGAEEPMSKHADHYNTNYAYGAASYNKGGVFVGQLGYIIGDAVLMRGMKRYYDEWHFKHPDPFDFIRVMEKSSGLHLGWYLNYMMNTTETIDYEIVKINSVSSSTEVELRRIGNFPMPIDLDITLKSGDQLRYHIPLDAMLGAKAAEDDVQYVVAGVWPWTHPTYTLSIDIPSGEISTIEIDASQRLADVNRTNNLLNLEVDKEVEAPHND